MHGFCRRLGILARAIDLVFEGLPPEREDIPDRNEVVDATIAIQSFVSNTFGCLDNLAWICVYEKDVRSEDGAELNPRSIGLGKGNKQVRSSFSNEFRAYLDTRQKWFDHLKGFRELPGTQDPPLHPALYHPYPGSHGRVQQVRAGLG